MSATLIIGGCRSGKSDQALALAERTTGNRKIFIATCVARDPEMKLRVEKHQLQRGSDWLTVETATDLPGSLKKHRQANVIIIDCLTLWVSNLLEAGLDDQQVLAKAEELGNFLTEPGCPVLLVTNEVGGGIVPENSLARRFRDLSGAVNRRIAGACQKVIWMVAGIPVTIKDIK